MSLLIDWTILRARFFVNLLVWALGLALGISLAFGQFGGMVGYWFHQLSAKTVNVKIVKVDYSYYSIQNREFATSQRAVSVVFEAIDGSGGSLRRISYFCEVCPASETRKSLGVRSLDELVGSVRLGYMVDGKVYLHLIPGFDIFEGLVLIFLSHAFAIYLLLRVRRHAMMYLARR